MTAKKEDYRWLYKWAAHLNEKHVLELGCGAGLDTAELQKYAKSVVATDLASNESTSTVQLDHSKPLPFKDNAFDIVVASLCLHYFSWDITTSILSDISRILRAKGLLICRLNSIHDYNYGARGYPEIEPNLYLVDGEAKRFFDLKDIERLFAPRWQLVELRESSIDRYNVPKCVWEFGAINTFDETL